MSSPEYNKIRSMSGGQGSTCQYVIWAPYLKSFYKYSPGYSPITETILDTVGTVFQDLFVKDCSPHVLVLVNQL